MISMLPDENSETGKKLFKVLSFIAIFGSCAAMLFTAAAAYSPRTTSSEVHIVYNYVKENAPELADYLERSIKKDYPPTRRDLAEVLLQAHIRAAQRETKPIKDATSNSGVCGP
jgi:hypothetical protein